MRVLPVALVAAAVAGCAGVPISETPRHLFSDSLFKPPAERISADDLFVLTDEMREFAATQVKREVERNGSYVGLFDTLRSGLRLDYDASGTQTAAQTFEARSGNCISLVILTAAFAKHLGVPVYYQSVIGQSTWSRSAGIAFYSGHVNLKVGSREDNTPVGRGFDGLTIDFLAPGTAAKFSSRPVSEQSLVAMYMNNRAAEALVRGDIDTAYAWARAAIETDPAYLVAPNTLGVIYLRHGNAWEAERAFRYVLTRAPADANALTNLAHLYTRLGRSQEAADLRRRLAALEPYPPFYFLDQGQAALQRGDVASALELFERELQRLPYNDEVHFALARAESLLGDSRGARKHLALAEKYSTTRNQRDIYSAKLTRLREQGSE